MTDEGDEAVQDIRDWLSGEIMYVDWRIALPHVLAELDRLGVIEQRAQSIVETPRGDLHHGRGAARAAQFILSGVWPDDTPS